MRKQHLLKTMLLLCALVAGSTSVWADEAGYTATSSDLPKMQSGEVTGSVTGTKSETWSYSVTQTPKSGKSAGGDYNDNYGWKIGTNNSPCTAFSISTSGISGTITKIEIVSGSKGASSKLSVKVGGSDFGTQSQATGSGETVATQTFEGAASGEIVVSASASSGAFYFKSITVTYSVPSDPSKNDAELSFTKDSYEITIGDDFDAPTVTNPHTLDVTYTSNNTDVAVVDSKTGAVTVKAVGTAKITASSDETSDYNAGSASYTLTVKKAPAAVVDGVFDFSYEDEFDYGSELSPSTSTGYITTRTEWVAGSVTMVTTGKYRWWQNDKTLRFYSDDNSAITLSVPAGKVITKIVIECNSEKTACTPTPGNYTVSGTTGTWTGAAQTVKLETSALQAKSITVTYKDVVSLSDDVNYTPVSVSDAVIALNRDFVEGWNGVVLPFDITDDVMTALGATAAKTLSSAVEESGNITLNFAEATLPVAAGTPVLVKLAAAKASGDIMLAGIELKDTEPTTVEKSAAGATFTLTGTYSSVELTDSEAYFVSGSKFYHKATGVALSAAPFRAYIVQTGGAGAPVLFNIDDTTTGIVAIGNSQLAIHNYYNLAGQRVQQPAKGLYIVNGKKYIVK